MLEKIIPREREFFTLFVQMGECILEGAHAFKKMLQDMNNVEYNARIIKEIEHKGDGITHRTIELLHKTFITPLDRNDIHLLISRMDDVLDLIEAASERIYLYGITETYPEMIKLSEVIVKSAENIQFIVRRFDNLKNTSEIKKHCVEINRLENEGDFILRTAIAKLFKEEPDTRNLIKLKEIYEILESVTDLCEDVANVVEGIVLEYA